MQQSFTFTVNRQSRTVTADPKRPLLEVLREDLGLTGTKYGCGEGSCRACTVLLDGRAVLSCRTPVSSVQGKSVTTIEGLAVDGRLHPVQEAFLSENASQCGYCTPGMILGLVSLLNESPRPKASELAGRMQGHLCRCCNYPNLTRAILKAATAAGTPSSPTLRSIRR